MKQTSYIKPQFYEKQKPKKFKSDISKRENMINKFKFQKNLLRKEKFHLKI